VTWALLVLTGAVPAWQSLDGGERARQLEVLKALPAEQRFVAATEGFLGTRYLLSPLGEGQGHDADPLIRFDAVDCVTMVEQAMALTLTPDDESLVKTLNGVRYLEEPSFDQRLHVMEAQWLPVNRARGLIEDVTARYGAGQTRSVTKRITAATWNEKSGRGLGLASQAQVVGAFPIELIPADRATALLSVAPEGLIVVVVRADRPHLVSRVTHVGVLVQKQAGPFLRHASRSFKKVVDEPLERYLKRNLEFGTWTVEGVALYRVVVALPVPDAGTSPSPDAGPPVTVAVAELTSPDAGTSPAQAPPPCGCSADTAGVVAALGLVLLVRRRRAGR
jgi:MYXO-CTERM domain-containing protein